MDTADCQTTIPKTLPNQSIFCPWISRAPLASSAATRHGQKASEQQSISGSSPQSSQNCHQTFIPQSCYNNSHQANINEFSNMTKPSASLRYPSIQQSSSQFFNFLRLMQLFPDVHPATLHTVLVLCKNDFFRSVDKLLYAQRCKQLYNSRRNVLQTCNCTSNSRCNRHKPYCYIRPAMANNCTSESGEPSQNGNAYLQSPLVLHGFGQMVPLDVSITRIQGSQNQSTSSGKGNENLFKVKTTEPRKILPRNRVKSKDKLLPSSTSTTDLPPVASPQCKLPIRPLSPLIGVPENLSSQSTSTGLNNTQ